jgi:hypothetical protein
MTKSTFKDFPSLSECHVCLSTKIILSICTQNVINIWATVLIIFCGFPLKFTLHGNLSNIKRCTLVIYSGVKVFETYVRYSD